LSWNKCGTTIYGWANAWYGGSMFIDKTLHKSPFNSVEMPDIVISLIK
jgi:hypothetical protein